MSYLLNVMMGKENLVRTILKKNGIPSQALPVKGYLLSDVAPPRDLLDEIPYIYKLLEVPDGTTGFFGGVEPAREGFRPGVTVEVIAGAYQDFKGIVREVMDGKIKVDLAIFGKVVPVELEPSELRQVVVCGSWV